MSYEEVCEIISLYGALSLSKLFRQSSPTGQKEAIDYLMKRWEEWKTIKADLLSLPSKIQSVIL